MHKTGSTSVFDDGVNTATEIFQTKAGGHVERHLRLILPGFGPVEVLRVDEDELTVRKFSEGRRQLGADAPGYILGGADATEAAPVRVFVPGTVIDRPAICGQVLVTDVVGDSVTLANVVPCPEPEPTGDTEIRELAEALAVIAKSGLTAAELAEALDGVNRTGD